MDEIATWFSIEMFNGVAKLASLSLSGRPMSVDAEKTVAGNFAEALWEGNRWDLSQHTPLIREGFRRLVAGWRVGLNENNADYLKRQFPLPEDLEYAIPAVEIPEERRIEYHSLKSCDIFIVDDKGYEFLNPKPTPTPKSDPDKVAAAREKYFEVHRGFVGELGTPLYKHNKMLKSQGIPTYPSQQAWDDAVEAKNTESGNA